MKQKEQWGFCETPDEKCTMNYCDENGCQNRERNLIEEKEGKAIGLIDHIIDEEFSDGMLEKLCPHEIRFIKNAIRRYAKEILPTNEEIKPIKESYSYCQISHLFRSGFKYGHEAALGLVIKKIEREEVLSEPQR